MRTPFFALMTATSVFAVTAAGATGYTLTLTQPSSVPVPSVKSITVTSQAQCADALNISYTATNGVISGATVTDSAATPSTDCIAMTVPSINISDSGSQTTGTVTGSRSYNSGTHTLAWNFNLSGSSFDLVTSSGTVTSTVALS